MFRFPRVFIVLWILLSLCAQAEVSARAGILMELETGRVLWEKNADERLPLASTTKVMTCLLALENAALSETVTASKNASGVPGTSIYLSEGETLTMEEILYGLMLRSGNDAAVAVAEHVAGSVSEFSKMMNARAEEIGADAYFTTPNGLDEGGNGASARALALISREAMRIPAFREIVSTTKKTIPWKDRQYARALTNKNRLLTTYEGALGIKTGFTSRAGRCLAFAAERDGMTVVGAVLRAPNWFADAAEIMDSAFSSFHVETLAEAGKVVATAPVAGSLSGIVELVPEKSLSVPLMEGEDCALEIDVLPLCAPVERGEICGTARAMSGGTEIARAALIADRTVEKSSYSEAVRRVLSHWPLPDFGK